MSLCWLAPAQRPSLRELRIMLLHLRSSRDELEVSEFDRRWNQLMPRSSVAAATTLPSVIADSRDDEEAEMHFSLAPSALPKRSPADIQPNVLPLVHGLAGSEIPPIVRPASFDSEFSSELNASLMAEAGSRRTSLRSSPGNTPDDFTVDDSFTAMAPHFTLASIERPPAADLKATTVLSSAFEMVSYGKTGEAEVTGSENQTKPDAGVSVSDNTPQMMPSSARTGALATEQAVIQETVKDNFDSGEEEWQSFSDVSANQNMNNSSVFTADQKSVMVNRTDGDEVHENVSNDVRSDSVEDGEKSCLAVENSHNAESDEGNIEQQDSKDGSFCMLKVSVGEDESPTKSLDIESPVKSTTSSADWCLVSNHTDHSREEELDTVSHVTDPSLPSDCVLVESEGKVGHEGLLEDVSNTDIGSADVQESASDSSATADKEQPTDNAVTQSD